jgi:hypothetical protein
MGKAMMEATETLIMGARCYIIISTVNRSA